MSRRWEMTPIEVGMIKAHIGDRLPVISVSGGKDSTACALLFQRLGIPYIAVHQDTGWENADTDHYVREVLPEHIGPIVITRSEVDLPAELVPLAEEVEAMLGKDYSAMVRWCLKKSMFPRRKPRWCTQYLKIYPLRDYLQQLDDEPVNVIGVRRLESRARANALWWEWDKTLDCETFRPLIRWTEEDVIDLHREMEVPPNPNYLRGASRVGCWPCIFARKHELRMMSEVDPGRVAAIRRLEEIMEELTRARLAAKGETFESKGWHPSAFFLNPRYSADKREGHPLPGRTVPIDEVIAWSRTKRGGRELEPFAPLPHERGCMRWGLCDSSWRTTTPALASE